MKKAFDEYFQSLNPVQKQVVESANGPSLVLAGAGSGKTRVLTCRIAYLIANQDVAPHGILAMTFTKKAANEMRERVARLTGDQSVTWLGTFHSLFSRILRNECDRIGYPRDFVIYDKEDQEKLVRSILDDMGLSTRDVSVRALSAIISRSKNRLIGPEEYRPEGHTPVERLVTDVYPRYQKCLHDYHAFDFDDLITVPIRLFQSNTDVLEKYRAQFRYILVDEYQDTNRAQYSLIRLLADAHRNLCVVGDDDQSIYRWRGADIRNILDFERDFPDTKVFRLEQNYRSTRNILKGAGSVVEKNKDRKGKTLWSEREAGESLESIEADDEHEEAMNVLEKIKEQVFKHKREFKHFAILYRTNAQSRSLEDVMRRSGISYIIVGGVRFYERKEIKDILAYLKLIVNPRDAVSLKRIVNFPVRGIGDVTLGKIQAWAEANGLSLFEALGHGESIPELSQRSRQALAGFYEMIQKYMHLRRQISVNELVHSLVGEIGFIAMYKMDPTEEGRERLENVYEFLSGVKEYAMSTDKPDLSDFLEEVALVSDVDRWNDKSNAVTLMTLHCAKGLEFPVVFITGLEEGLFPVSRSLDEPEALEEERRLFYVGVTRAIDKVYMLWAHRRNTAYDGGFRIPSRFLSEMDPSVVETSGSRTKWGSEEPVRHRKTHWDDADLGFEGGSSREHKESEGSLYRKGMNVRHEIFGNGVVTEVEGQGEKQKITVRFRNSGNKKFVAKYVSFEVF